MQQKHVFRQHCFGFFDFWTFFLSIFNFLKKLSQRKTWYFQFFKYLNYILKKLSEKHGIIKYLNKLKMGCFLSREKAGVSIYQQHLEVEAMRRFNARVANYSYPHHGPYVDYIEWCRGQFCLECIPEGLRYGENYTPQYDAHGVQVY